MTEIKMRTGYNVVDFLPGHTYRNRRVVGYFLCTRNRHDGKPGGFILQPVPMMKKVDSSDM